jgi:hypothetical protein
MMLWNCCVCLARSSGVITQGSIMAHQAAHQNQSIKPSLFCKIDQSNLPEIIGTGTYKNTN